MRLSAAFALFRGTTASDARRCSRSSNVNGRTSQVVSLGPALACANRTCTCIQTCSRVRGSYLDVEVSYVERMQESNPVQNLLQQSGDLPLLRNFVPVEYHLQLAAGSSVAINVKPSLSLCRAVFTLSVCIISRIITAVPCKRIRINPTRYFARPDRRV